MHASFAWSLLLAAGVVVASLVPLGAARSQADFQLSDLAAPRAMAERLPEWGKRANWAHLNSFEAFTLFAPAALLCLIVSQVGGPTAAYAALSIGLFNSIMFPTIFTLTLERSTAPTSATSGLLVFGIIGGALLPQVAARIADAAGALQPAFIVPMLGYVGLTVFAIAAARTKVRDADVVAAPSPH
jgi:uncharacterized MAPEG superfamily protein